MGSQQGASGIYFGRWENYQRYEEIEESHLPVPPKWGKALDNDLHCFSH